MRLPDGHLARFPLGAVLRRRNRKGASHFNSWMRQSYIFGSWFPSFKITSSINLFISLWRGWTCCWLGSWNVAKTTTQRRFIAQVWFLIGQIDSRILIGRKKTIVRDAEEKILPYVNNDQSLKDSLLISKALIDHHLPFLPLERNHVRRCIKNAIQVNLYNS